MHGWQSERWVLGVCGSVMREGWAKIFKYVMSVSGGVDLCLIGGERHGPDSSGIDLKFR